MHKKNFKALSLFSSAGIAEFGLKKTDVEVLIASELVPSRVKVHNFWHPNVESICGDISDKNIQKTIINKSIEKGINFILATPPCQGVSLIGKNKSNEDMLNDQRNYLIFHVFKIIDEIKPDIVLIENVSRFFKIKYPVLDKLSTIEEIIREKYGNFYNLDFNLFNTSNYGVPQNRERSIIRMWKSNYSWLDPKSEKPITVKEAIGHLPSIESGDYSKIKNHFARNHINSHIKIMKNTPTGRSAFDNEIHFPKNELTGQRLKGFSATYKRISWDKPAPTITMRNDCISSQSNVHPGRLLEDGTYSDARVLTLRELFILSSIDPDLDLPPFASDIQIRHLIGEAVPPLLIEKLVKEIRMNE